VAPYAGLQYHAKYTFDGNIGDTAGVRHGSIITGSPMLTTDHLGEPNAAYFFDGDDTIAIVSPFVSSLAADFTITIWIMPTEMNDGAWHGFIGYEGPTSGREDDPSQLTRSPSLWVNFIGCFVGLCDCSGTEGGVIGWGGCEGPPWLNGWCIQEPNTDLPVGECDRITDGGGTAALLGTCGTADTNKACCDCAASNTGNSGDRIPGNGLHWDTRTAQPGNPHGGARFAGVVDGFFAKGEYTHIVWAKKGEACTFYKNGAQTDTTVCPSQFDAHNVLWIGNSYGYPFHGAIDEVTFYDFGLEANDAVGTYTATTTYTSVNLFDNVVLPAYARGCTDSAAANYDPTAAQNDGSCTYDCDGLTGGDAPAKIDCYVYDSAATRWGGGRLVGAAVVVQGLLQSNATKEGVTALPRFDARPQLRQQSLALRHVRVEGHEAFGGSGLDHGAALWLTVSTCAVESVDFVGNTQRGVGAGVVYAVTSNATFLFARFEDNRNLGLGAGVLVASAGSSVAFSHSQFLGSVADNQMGLLGRFSEETFGSDNQKRPRYIGYWPLDFHGRDVSGSRLDGQPTNVEWVTGKYGEAAHFSSDSMILVVDSGDTVLDVTNVMMVAWINPSDVGGRQTSADTQLTSDTDIGVVMIKDNAYEFGVEDNSGQLQGAFGPGCWRWWGNAVIPVDEWTHVAVGVDGTSERHFVNGVFTEQDGCVGSLTRNDKDFKIGARGYREDVFKGAVDEAMLFDHLLSDGELRGLYYWPPSTLQSASCITADASAVSATHSLFERNRGADVIAAGSASTVDLDHTLFRSNDVSQCKLALPFVGPVRDCWGPTVTNCWLPTVGSVGDWKAQQESSCSGAGAAVSLHEGSVATLLATSFIGNVGGAAGAIVAVESTVTLTHTACRLNQASGPTVAAGAILLMSNAAAHAVHCEFTGNSASAPDAAGGAIFATDRVVVHGTQCTFDGNVAGSQLAAGAVYAAGAAEITLMNTTLRANRVAPHPGSVFGAGAIYTHRTSLSLTHSTIGHNHAAGGTELTASNYATALNIRSPLRILVRDSIFERLALEGQTAKSDEWDGSLSIHQYMQAYMSGMRDLTPDQRGVQTVVIITPQVVRSSVVQGSCQQYPCAQGSSCSHANFSTSCHPCPEGAHGLDGVKCELCPPGTGPSADQTRCELCGGPDNPRAYSPFGVCLECHGANVVSTDPHAQGPTDCDPCPIGLGPANVQRTHCAPCQGNTMSKSGICEACPGTKVGDGDGISCSDCPPNAEPSDVPLACRCKEGYYNSSFGLVQCKPSPMPALQIGVVCQPCGACLDCEASLTTFTRALVQPGYKLGVAATRTYRGVERGDMHVNKVLHKCSHGASVLLSHSLCLSTAVCHRTLFQSSRRPLSNMF
jgi:hypothetical protein